MLENAYRKVSTSSSLTPENLKKKLIPRNYLLAQTTQNLIQVLYWDKDKCFFFGHTLANKVYPDQTAPEELSDQGILYLQKTQKGDTRER